MTLPSEVQRLLDELHAPIRLVDHLRLVHETACDIFDGLAEKFPALKVDRDAVVFGAATHDMGKVLHPEELVGPGNRHEEVGPALLEKHGVPRRLARFARTHGQWDAEPVEIEDLLVALADCCATHRNDALESMLVERLAGVLGMEKWEVLLGVEEVVEGVGDLYRTGRDRRS